MYPKKFVVLATVAVVAKLIMLMCGAANSAAVGIIFAVLQMLGVVLFSYGIVTSAAKISKRLPHSRTAWCAVLGLLMIIISF